MINELEELFEYTLQKYTTSDSEDDFAEFVITKVKL